MQGACYTLKQTAIIFALVFVLTGCATYKYDKASDPYKGYVVKRNDYLIPEYTTDTKNKAPEDLALAKARFKRRHAYVEDYYKKMGRIENQFKALFVDYPIEFVGLMTAVIRLPFVAVSDFKSENNPKYREKVEKREEALDKKEDRKRMSLQDALNKYIEKDLENEAPVKTTN